LISTDRTGQ